MLVRDGEVIGEGFHAELGGLHAERAALADCRERGEDPAGATMYVTLEPCAHQGRQPPCTEAILEAGIARVVIGSDDPSEKAAGRGPGILRDGGVEVEFAAGAEATAARLLNQPFRKHARTGLPLVTLKLAMSLDGAHRRPPPATRPGSPASAAASWSTAGGPNPTRSRSGIGTVLADDPLLTARHRRAPAQPLRVVFDSPGPPAARLAAPAHARPVARARRRRPDGRARSRRRPARRRRRGPRRRRTIDRPPLSPSSAAAASPASSSRAAGPSPRPSRLLTQIDEARTFVAPILLGDRSLARVARVRGPRTTSPAGAPITATGPARRTALSTEVETIGDDVLITARFKEW